MVVAKFGMDASRLVVSLHVKGHAGQNTPGNDIVCASASILAYTLAQNIKMSEERGHLKYSPKIKLKEGDSIITCRAKDEETYAEILHTFLVIQTGYMLLAHNYPQYVAVEMFGQAEEP
jgi:uncharacterized protein YsxB (DUF464 family)